MHMPMINIGKVRMLVGQRDVLMQMFVRCFLIPIKIVHVIVMFVVCMLMRMLNGIMRVIMLVVLGQVQPDTHGHQRRSEPEWRCRRFTQQQQ